VQATVGIPGEVVFFDAADKETERLQSAEAAAKIRLAVSKLDAQGSVADVTELGARLKELFPNADPNVIMEQVGRLGAADRLARLTNLRAIGSGSVIGLDDQNTNTGSGGNKKATGKGGGKGGKK
jgi:adenylyl- and sulfurtransferase ThiI